MEQHHRTGAFTTLTQGGNNVVDVTTAFGGDVTGTIGATVVGDDSHNHTDATIADNLTINGGTVLQLNNYSCR